MKDVASKREIQQKERNEYYGSEQHEKDEEEYIRRWKEPYEEILVLNHQDDSYDEGDDGWDDSRDDSRDEGKDESSSGSGANKSDISMKDVQGGGYEGIGGDSLSQSPSPTSHRGKTL
ncbi:hypothetical protein PspLS_00040 [Pyricularia sp. CBS 133598]|nr:hypothetical protein PspLS_00040 [Pyricularia sp. CBS 133598]